MRLYNGFSLDRSIEDVHWEESGVTHAIARKVIYTELYKYKYKICITITIYGIEESLPSLMRKFPLTTPLSQNYSELLLWTNY